MNVRDSEVISGLLRKAGFRISDDGAKADIVIFNTCSVRQHAEDRVWSLIGSYKGSKIIGLVGCMAQNYKERAFERDANISFVVGPQDIGKIPEVVEKILKTRGQSPKNGDSHYLYARFGRRIAVSGRKRFIILVFIRGRGMLMWLFPKGVLIFVLIA